MKIYEIVESRYTGWYVLAHSLLEALHVKSEWLKNEVTTEEQAEEYVKANRLKVNVIPIDQPVYFGGYDG